MRVLTSTSKSNSFLKIFTFSLFAINSTWNINAFAQVVFQPISYDSAVVLAKTQNKMVLLDFRAEWCKPCLEMERTTLKDSLLGDYVNARFIAIKMDVDSAVGKQYANRFGVNEYPTFMVINPENEQPLLSLIGYKPARIFLGDLKMLERKK